MTAKEIKAEILHNLSRFGGSFACLEWCGYDVVFVDWKGRLREIEIKVSMSDLRREHKKWKWHSYNKDHYPAYYHFCLIPEIAEKGLEYINEHFLFAGVYVYDGKWFKCLKKAKRLHDNKVNNRLLMSIARSLYLKVYKS